MLAATPVSLRFGRSFSGYVAGADVSIENPGGDTSLATHLKYRFVK
ncbi:hypothetical protein ACWC0C_27815 [Streptomyces sp. NPDC001709]